MVQHAWLPLRIVVILAVAWGAFEVVAGVYRQQHCILVFGHWLTVTGPAIPLFCQ